jgi:hypothetical protein
VRDCEAVFINMGVALARPAGGMCADNLTNTVWRFVPTTVLVVYCFQL